MPATPGITFIPSLSLRKREKKGQAVARQTALVILLWMKLAAGLGLVLTEVGVASAAGLLLEGLQLHVENNEKRVSWQFSATPVAVNAFPLSAPARLVIDVSGLTSGGPAETYQLADETLLRIRQGTHPQHIRFVLDFKGKTVPDFVVEQDGVRIAVVFPIPQSGKHDAYTQVLFPRNSVTRDTVHASPAPAPPPFKRRFGSRR